MSDTRNTSPTVSLHQLIKENIRSYSMFIMLGLIFVVFSVFTGGVNFSPRNISNIFMQNSYILILAAGMVLVIIVGNIDLSVGSIAAFTGAISAMIYNTGVGLPLTVVFTMAAGVGIGFFQGFWIAFAKIPAFIVTLAGMLLFRGLTYVITNVSPIALRDDGFRQITSGFITLEALHIGRVHYFAWLLGGLCSLVWVLMALQERRGKMKKGFEILPLPAFLLKSLFVVGMILLLSWKFAEFRGVPVIVVVLAVVVGVFTFITKRTVIGRYIYAVGGNAKSAKLSGINSEMVIFVVHTIMGMLSGLAGLVFAGYMNSALPQAGQLFELDAIAACFIGGASASGGIGTIVGAIIGGLVMGVINNGMSLMNIGADWQYVVKALVLLLAVFYDIYTRRKAGLA
ncbi:putative multiple sugar transport system permease protein [Alkalispirochaeta americana]|uniref:Xylose transport system permease protein XylH n=1 Tax=Alkalispirochaeta americana TaxID=159291 RepID=A0A1N6SDR5_9SPIO|nr:multiple monosaccharide ABC transporter permease [Alkalispirochaeta americana]SIQ39112.1 putative multiple sugar transport system permease protein [Alkalispirochaeta americana]